MLRNFQIKLVPAIKTDENGQPVTDENGQVVRVLQIVLPGNDANEEATTLPDLRPYIRLDPEDVEKLLSGEMKNDAEGKEFINKIESKISTWLLGTDLDLALNMTWKTLSNENSSPPSRLRLIFSVDPQLRPNFDFSAVPIELLRPLTGQSDPYAVSDRVASILHLLDKIGTSPNTASTLKWPLRVLIVRSNPDDLGGAVPRAVPFANKILEFCKDIGAVGPTAIKIDVMTKEVKEAVIDGEVVEQPKPELEIIEGATWDTFRQRLSESNKDPYDILVYLGHGSLKVEGATSEGCLQFESPDGTSKKEVEAWKLVDPLKFNPVPVVLLVGCYTAAKFNQLEDNKKKVLNKKRAEWVQGSQGVAQSLINSNSGVHVVVGMRYRLEMDDALTFLGSFFNNLLKTVPGDVEAAVHYARRELRNTSQFIAAWSAPVVFRRLRGTEDEPVFKYLAMPPPPPPTCDTPEGNWGARTIIWKRILKRPWSARSQDEKNEVLSSLKEFEDVAINTAVAKAPLIMPEMLPQAKLDFIIKQPGDEITVPIKLYGSINLEASELKGEVIIDRDVTIAPLKASQELKDCGYKLMMDEPDRHQVTFYIKPNGTGNLKVLKDIPLFNITFTLSQEFNIQCSIAINGLKTDPQKIVVCPGTNAVMIPLP